MIGKAFKVSIFGESHGTCVGALIEGCPPGLRVDEELLRAELRRRRPGSALTSPRREEDEPVIMSGVFRGRSTGAPILIIIYNRDRDSSFYEAIKDTPRPSHADYVARVKYWGMNDYRGGGIFSGRLTAALVAAGAVAKELLGKHGVRVYSYVVKVGDVEASVKPRDSPEFREAIDASPVKCPDPRASELMEGLVRRVSEEGDSVGGVVETVVFNAPVGLGSPPADTLDGDVAKAVFAVPGVKGVEFGAGFRMAGMRGSEANDPLVIHDGEVVTETNNSGGINGGLSNGAPIVFRVAFRPTPTIRKPQRTVNLATMQPAVIEGWGRHDPCIAIRAAPAVEAVTALVLADHLLRWYSWEGMRSRILG